MSVSPFRELERILIVLRKLKLPHALIGGWAVIAWGFLRASDDLDLMVGLPTPRRRELLEALSANFKAQWLESGPDDPVPGLIRAFPRDEGGLPVDLIPARGRPDRAALSRAVEVTVEGVAIPVVGPEDLLAMKLEAGGGQDYEDVRRLLGILADRLDEARLQESCRERRALDRLALLRR